MSEFQKRQTILKTILIIAIIGGILIGIATIAAFIGSGGLGVPIFRGIRNNRTDLIVIGTICVSLLALLIDGLMYWIERRLTPRGLKSRKGQLP